MPDWVPEGDAGVDFRILGRLEALDDGVDVAPRRAQPRALLAMFLLHPNEPLTTDRLIEALWGETAPATADKALQGHVSVLRKALGDLLVGEPLRDESCDARLAQGQPAQPCLHGHDAQPRPALQG